MSPIFQQNPFFQTWELRGRYPNRGYPRIFEDETVGAEAKKVFDDAQKMLKSIIDGRKLQANGVAAFYAANSVGDDIEVYEDDERTSVKQVLHTNHALLSVEKAGQQAVVHVAIDNLLKGAAGQAVQNMNLMFQLSETAGLRLKPGAF